MVIRDVEGYRGIVFERKEELDKLAEAGDEGAIAALIIDSESKEEIKVRAAANEGRGDDTINKARKFNREHP